MAYSSDSILLHEMVVHALVCDLRARGVDAHTDWVTDRREAPAHWPPDVVVLTNSRPAVGEAGACPVQEVLEVMTSDGVTLPSSIAKWKHDAASGTPLTILVPEESEEVATEVLIEHTIEAAIVTYAGLPDGKFVFNWASRSHPLRSRAEPSRLIPIDRDRETQRPSRRLLP